MFTLICTTVSIKSSQLKVRLDPLNHISSTLLAPARFSPLSEKVPNKRQAKDDHNSILELISVPPHAREIMASMNHDWPLPSL